MPPNSALVPPPRQRFPFVRSYPGPKPNKAAVVLSLDPDRWLVASASVPPRPRRWQEAAAPARVQPQKLAVVEQERLDSFQWQRCCLPAAHLQPRDRCKSLDRALFLSTRNRAQRRT